MLRLPWLRTIRTSRSQTARTRPIKSTATGQATQEAIPGDQSAQAQNGNAIVVTGLRRAETLQDTPAAITAFGSQEIVNAGIQKPADFINLTSNVNLVEVQNVGTSFVVIRGITQARNSEPSVAVVIDGVQQVNPSQFNQDLFDIQQIEVLKGPQGALYGRNAIGGAIIITTKQPTDQLEGKVTVGIDNGFGSYIHGGVSGPIANGVKFRVAGLYKDTNGYIPNTYLSKDADPYKDFAAAREPAVRHGQPLEPRSAGRRRTTRARRRSGTISSMT